MSESAKPPPSPPPTVIDPRKKEIHVISDDNGRTWKTTFVGNLSNGDFQKMNRVIRTQYSKFNRQRSVARMRQIQLQTDPQVNFQETPIVKEPSNAK